MHTHPSRRTMVLVSMGSSAATLALAGAVLVSALVFAEPGNPAGGERVIPYNGYLALDGAAYNGLVDLRFTLTDGLEGPSDEEHTWSECHSQVEAFAGRFSVGLGASSAGAIPDWVFHDADAVYLSIAVRPHDGEDDTCDPVAFTPLSNAQRITPAPFAYLAASANDFHSRGNAFIEGALTVNDRLRVNNSPDVDFATDREGGLTIANGSQRMSFDGNEIVARDGDQASILYLNASGAGGAVQLGGNLAFGSDSDSGERRIDFPDNLWGGTGDDAWIRYYQDGSGEDSAFQIGIGDVGEDDLEFHQSGAVRMRIEDGDVHISDKLHIGGGLTLSNFSTTRSDICEAGNPGDTGSEATCSLQSAHNAVCFLSSVEYFNAGDSATADGAFECTVRERNGDWVLDVGGGYNAGVTCTATCLTWNNLPAP